MSTTKPLSPVNFAAAVEAAQQVQKAIDALKCRQADLRLKREELEAASALLYRAPLPRDEVKQMILANIDAVAAKFPAAARWGRVFQCYAQPAGQRPPGAGPVSDDHVGGTHNGPICLHDLEWWSKRSRDFSIDSLAGLDVANFFHGAGKSGAPMIAGDTSDLSATSVDETPELAKARAYFFFGDIIKQKVSQHFDRLYPDPAERSSRAEARLSIAERQQKIAENAGRVATIDAELAEIERQLSELPNHPRPKA